MEKTLRIPITTKFVLVLITGLVWTLAGCANVRPNSQFTLKVSSTTAGSAFDGQCTSQVADLRSGVVAKGIKVQGIVPAPEKPQEFAMTGFYIYCVVANQASNSLITVELWQNGNMVARSTSSAPDEPVLIEFGEKP